MRNHKATSAASWWRCRTYFSISNLWMLSFCKL